MNDFEKRLRQVPVKPLPQEWRVEILAATAAVQPAPVRSELFPRQSFADFFQVGRRFSFSPGERAGVRGKRSDERPATAHCPSTISSSPPERGVHATSTWLARMMAVWNSLFWPHPQAWAGLAVIWVIIALLHFSQRDESPVRVEKSAPPSPEMLADLRQQQQMLVELLGLNGAGEADRPKKAGPHTQLVRVMMV